MLDFLKEVDISDDIINEMYHVHSNEILYSLKTNAENCLGIIMFLREMKITVIDDLLIYKPEWFLKTISSFIDCFQKDANLVQKINDNYLDIYL